MFNSKTQKTHKEIKWKFSDNSDQILEDGLDPHLNMEK